MGIALSDIVQTSLVASAVSPSVPGFGKSLVMLNKVPGTFPAAPQSYSNGTGLISAGFLTTDDAYLAMNAADAPTPAPPLVEFAKRSNKTTQVMTFVVQNAISNTVYAVTCTTPAGVSATASYTAGSTPTTTSVATGLAAAIAAITGFAGTTSSAATITVASPAAGTLNGFSNWTSNLYLLDASTDPGITADLAAAIAADNTWYGLELDSHSKAEILAAAAWAEANKKLLVVHSCDSGIADNTVTTDVATAIQAASYQYTAILYNGNNTKSFAGLTWQSGRFAGSPTPGNDTWFGNTLPGVIVDNLSETQFATLGSKNATGYVTIQGVNVTAAGGISITKSGSTTGSGVFLDTRRFQDWLLAQIQIGIYIDLIGGIKTPYTDKGLSQIANSIYAALLRGEQAGGLVAGSSVVAQPTAASQAQVDRAARTARNMNWTSRNAGAVHLVQSSGTVLT